MTGNHVKPLSSRISAPRLSLSARRPSTRVRLPYGPATKMIAPRIAPEPTRGDDAPARAGRARVAAPVGRTTGARRSALPEPVARTRADASPQSVSTRLKTRARVDLSVGPTSGAAALPTADQRRPASPIPNTHTTRGRSAGPRQRPQHSRRTASAQMREPQRPETDLGDEFDQVRDVAARRERIDASR